MGLRPSSHREFPPCVRPSCGSLMTGSLTDFLTGCRTVDNLLAECPDFWCSRQLWSVLRHGPLVEADPGFFASQLVAVLQSARHGSGDNGRNSSSGKGQPESEEAAERRHRAARRLRVAVDEFVGECPSAVLCRRLLHLLLPGDIVAAARALVDHLPCQTDRQLEPSTASKSASRDTPATPRSPSRGDLATTSGRDGAASSMAQSPTARQLALQALTVGCSQQGLSSLLVSHSAVLNSEHMLRWLQEDEEGAQVGATSLPLFASVYGPVPA